MMIMGFLCSFSRLCFMKEKRKFTVRRLEVGVGQRIGISIF